MLKQLRKRTEGFTIIEVMIVLAIAGLILLIVFLAVPALQRNSRNTQSKSDAAALLGAAQEWANNNNGATPAAANSGAISGLAKTKNITTLTIEVAAPTNTAPTLNNAVLVTTAKCPGGGGTLAITMPGSTVAGLNIGTSTRQYVLVYGIEDKTGAVTAVCTES